VAVAACLAALVASSASAEDGPRCAAAKRLVAESKALPGPLRLATGTTELEYGVRLACAGTWGGSSSTTGKNTYVNVYATSPWVAIQTGLTPAQKRKAQEWIFHVAYFAYASIVPHAHVDDFGYEALGVAACQVERWSIERLAFTRAIPL